MKPIFYIMYNDGTVALQLRAIRAPGLSQPLLMSDIEQAEKECKKLAGKYPELKPRVLRHISYEEDAEVLPIEVVLLDGMVQSVRNIPAGTLIRVLDYSVGHIDDMRDLPMDEDGDRYMLSEFGGK